MMWVPLLLADRSPCLRFLVLRDLLLVSNDNSEVQELSTLRETDPLVINLLKLQNKNGSWYPSSISKGHFGDKIASTSLVLNRLGFLGFDSSFSAVQKGVEFIYANQEKDGSWPISGKSQLIDEERGYQMMPIQTAIPLLSLALCGYACDSRSELAYDWLMEQRLDDGAWPAGIISGVYGGIAGYRRLAHSQFGCRSSTTAVLNCFALHPNRSKSSEAKKALDLLLGTDMKLRNNIGFIVARTIGVESAIGRITYFAKFDIGHLLDLCWRIGANTGDERVKEFVNFIKAEQGYYGMWEYIGNPIANRWVTFDLLRSLSKLDTNEDWLSYEPRTPFRAYPRKKRRF